MVKTLLEIDGTQMENLHFKWSRDNKPIASVRSGDTVRFKIPDSSTMQVKEDWTKEDMKRFDASILNGAVGPVLVLDAKRGDVLEVEILEIRVGDWGWSTTERNFGLIKGRFDDNLVVWKLHDGFAESASDFLKGTRIPLDPFLGVMGVAPESGEFPMAVPQAFGGNMDNKLLTAGSRLYLPVQTEGALFSVADPHGAQGDGESAATGIETSATAVMRLSVRKDKPIRYPRAISTRNRSPLYVTMGVSTELYEASRIAMEEMIDELTSKGYSGNEAYVLCGLTGNLTISELVEPNYVVSMSIPLKFLDR